MGRQRRRRRQGRKPHPVEGSRGTLSAAVNELARRARRFPWLNLRLRGRTEAATDSQVAEFRRRLRPSSRGEHPTKIERDNLSKYNLVEAWEVPSQHHAQFQRIVEREGRRIRVYHGTSPENSVSVVLQALKLPSKMRSGMFGNAIYVTPDIEKAIGYGGVSDRRVVFAGWLAPGRCLRMENAEGCLTREKLAERGYDTVLGQSGSTTAWGGSLRFTEYAVYDPERVIVTHLLLYEQKES